MTNKVTNSLGNLVTPCLGTDRLRVEQGFGVVGCGFKALKVLGFGFEALKAFWVVISRL
jgi:hypothetical protein